jgi:glycosyltransferase involved in cell wall biosynthesis
MKKVSVIIPAFNNSHYTIKTINSILEQTYKNIEIIVIDDGSTDDTKIKLKLFGKLITYIYQKNKGASSARNKGMKISTGEYIAHIDCDDLYENNKIEESIKFLENNNDYSFIYTDVNLIDENDNFINQIKKFNNHPGSGYIAKKILTTHYVLTNSTVVAKKECYESLGGFDEKIFISADREMMIRLSIKYKAGYINRPLTKYRVFNNTTYKNLDYSLSEFIYIIDKYSKLNFFKNKDDINISYANIYYYYFKLQISLGNFDKAKILFIKIFQYKFFFNKTIFIIIASLFLYLWPKLIMKYLKKYNSSIK